jgi:hypothetical protein
MFDALESVRNSLRYDYGKGGAVSYVAKLEITYDGEKDKYHPHFHLIVKGKKVQKSLLKKWLKFSRKKGLGKTNPGAQSSRPVEDGDALVEVLKYVTKFGEKEKTEDGGKKFKVYPPKKLDRIFRAIRGKKILRTCGDFHNTSEKFETVEEEVDEEIAEEATVEEFKRYGEKVLWEWDRDYTTTDDAAPQGDWVDKKTGEYLVSEGPEKPPENDAQSLRNGAGNGRETPPSESTLDILAHQAKNGSNHKADQTEQPHENRHLTAKEANYVHYHRPQGLTERSITEDDVLFNRIMQRIQRQRCDGDS